MLMLNSGYYQVRIIWFFNDVTQDWNDNIILALCELPSIEAIGPILIIDFAENPDQVLSKYKFQNKKQYSKQYILFIS